MSTECWTPQSSHRDTFFSIYLVVIGLSYVCAHTNMAVACIQKHAVPHYNSILYSNIVTILQTNSNLNDCSIKANYF